MLSIFESQKISLSNLSPIQMLLANQNARKGKVSPTESTYEKVAYSKPCKNYYLLYH